MIKIISNGICRGSQALGSLPINPGLTCLNYSGQLRPCLLPGSGETFGLHPEPVTAQGMLVPFHSGNI